MRQHFTFSDHCLKRAELLLISFVCAFASLQAAEPDKWRAAIDEAEQLHEAGSLSGARIILLSALQLAAPHKDGTKRLAYTYNGLGSVAQDQGQYFEAEKYYRAISYWQDGQERPPLGLGGTLNNLASLLDSAGKAGEAQALLRRSEAILVDYARGNELAMGVVLQNRGTGFFRQRKYREAEKAYHRARIILEPLGEPGELQLARVANDLGLVCEKLGRKDEARSHYGLARTVWEKHVESRGAAPEILINLAAVYLKLKKDQQATAVLQRGLAIAERRLGPDNPYRAGMLFLYAAALRQSGNKAEAARAAKEAKAIQSNSQRSLARHTIAFSELSQEK